MKHLLFLGIAGHAMGGLALAAQNRGYTITGLDEAGGPPMSTWLDEHSLKWSTTYTPEILEGVDAIVVNAQHGSDDHPVIVHARKHHMRIMSFAEFLGELTLSKHVIAVAGTHGKTTTTSLITWLLESAGQTPDYLIGILPFNFQASSRLNGASKVVIEADEYKASTLDPKPKFDYYHPNTLVLTSIEHDHPDVFPTMSEYLAAFKRLATNISAEGTLIACTHSKEVMQIAQAVSCKVLTYGLEQGDYTASNIAFDADGLAFDVVTSTGVMGRLKVPLYGRHNVLNALAAVAVASHEGMSFEQIAKGALAFKGAFRRFNVLTKPAANITVIDDYAHHPTEVLTTIEAARLHFPNRRLVVIYRPHTYSRTQTLLKEYRHAFAGADQLYITDVEPARELAHQRTVSGQEIVDGLSAELRQNTAFVIDRDDLVDQIIADVRPGDVILSMTVSGYGNIANELAEKLA